jgi:ankyrin repeat protein
MQSFSLSAAILAAGLAGCAHPPSAASPSAPATAATPPARPASNDRPAAPASATPASDAAGRFLAAVRAGDLPAVQQQLAGDPALASARTERGTSALQVALFRIQDNQEDFYPPAANPILQAVLAAHPALDPFETAAVGDPAALAALVAADPSLITRVHEIGWTVLHFAAFGGNASAVRLLLDHGAAIELRAANKFANTPLHVALLTGDHTTTQLLVERGANLAARYDGGTTPLHLAAALGRVDLVSLLLAHGAAIDARLDSGATALSLAVKNKHSEAAALLRQHGARG